MSEIRISRSPSKFVEGHGFSGYADEAALMDFFHCLRRSSANKPSGEEEEIVQHGEPLLFFIARAFLVFPT
jgi:hypothetical protein